ncbi:MAG: UbiX family flavin prenyltransferase [Vampirovibrionales bacterium]|nr:UbiX family flavin prenyltransferase [Vampirovibrionales bacterium]
MNPLNALNQSPMLAGSAKAATTGPPVIVGITGASGTILAMSLIKALLMANRAVAMVATEKALPVILQEEGLKITGASKTEKRDAVLGYLKQRLDLPDTTPETLLTLYGNHELDAAISSGTCLTQGMVIMPCSMGTLGRISAGIGDNLVARAADVTLKEARKLVLVPREAPLNAIHLENMLKLARLGVVIIPPMLTFYLPDYLTLQGQIDVTVGKVLDQLQIEHTLYKRWGETAS